MSINNLIVEWIKILDTGDKTKLFNYTRDLEKILPNKEIMKTLENIKVNTLENLVKWAREETICDHLGIDHKLLKPTRSSCLQLQISS